MPTLRHVASILVLALALHGSVGATAFLGAPPAEDGVAGVTLRPVAFLTGDARAAWPTADAGLYTGAVDATGEPVRLVRTDAGVVGLVGEGAALRWFTVQDGRMVLVPGAVGPARGTPVGDDARVPAVSASAPPRGPVTVDGTLQIALEADGTLTAALGADGAAAHVTRVAFLAASVFELQLDVPWSVVDVRTWPEGDPYDDRDEDAFLDSIRHAWEREAPTTRAERELVHTSTLRDFGGTVGLAFLASLEDAWAYGFHVVEPAAARDGAPLALAAEALLTAHEVGHNFDGWHELASPTPDGALDPGDCFAGHYATIMYPCAPTGYTLSPPVFSDASLAPDFASVLHVAEDGGNAWWMRHFADGRI